MPFTTRSDPLNTIPKSLAVCKVALISWNELGARTKTWLLLGLIITTNPTVQSCESLWVPKIVVP